MVAVISVCIGIYVNFLRGLPGAPDILSPNYSSLFSVMTFFLSLLMVFRWLIKCGPSHTFSHLHTPPRLNQAYSRWWEGRTQWGSNLATLRSYLMLSMVWVRPHTRPVAEAIARWVPAAFRRDRSHRRLT